MKRLLHSMPKASRALKSFELKLISIKPYLLQNRAYTLLFQNLFHVLKYLCFKRVRYMHKILENVIFLFYSCTVLDINMFYWTYENTLKYLYHSSYNIYNIFNNSSLNNKLEWLEITSQLFWHSERYHFMNFCQPSNAIKSTSLTSFW